MSGPTVTDTIAEHRTTAEESADKAKAALYLLEELDRMTDWREGTSAATLITDEWVGVNDPDCRWVVDRDSYLSGVGNLAERIADGETPDSLYTELCQEITPDYCTRDDPSSGRLASLRDEIDDADLFSLVAEWIGLESRVQCVSDLWGEDACYGDADDFYDMCLTMFDKAPELSCQPDGTYTNRETGAVVLVTVWLP